MIDTATNAEVLGTVDVTLPLIKIARKRHLQCVGHIDRRVVISKLALCGEIIDKTDRRLVNDKLALCGEILGKTDRRLVIN